MPNKPLPYNPRPREVLLCDYSGLVPPEMAKVRFVVVITPRHLNTGSLCTVVPISTSAPQKPQLWHVKLDKDPYPKGKEGVEVWVKCDMVMRVSYSRLTAYYDGKTAANKRNYVNLFVSDDEFKKIQRGVAYALGMGAIAHNL